MNTNVLEGIRCTKYGTISGFTIPGSSVPRKKQEVV